MLRRRGARVPEDLTPPGLPDPPVPPGPKANSYRLSYQQELRLVGQSFDCPLLVNMAEGGKTPLVPAHELEALGFRLVIFPGTLYRAAVPAMQRVLQEIKKAGTTQGMLDQLLSFEGRNQITGLSRIYDLERQFLPPS